jgi:hypothetical protein
MDEDDFWGSGFGEQVIEQVEVLLTKNGNKRTPARRR